MSLPAGRAQRVFQEMQASPMPSATFRFYEELNDFLPPTRRKQAFAVDYALNATVKHQIEALGVPHTEVELILVNGVSVDFHYPLRHGDRVAVYPKFEALDITPLLRVRDWPLRQVRFVADAHLGGLARLLRLAGFDTLYDNHFQDEAVERLAVTTGRIVLSRDRELLKRRGITHGCFVHPLKPWVQLAQIVQRLDLARLARPFSLCMTCNTTLYPVARDRVLHRLPPAVRERHTHFQTCTQCGRVYWQGSHWQHMAKRLAAVLGRDVGAGKD